MSEIAGLFAPEGGWVVKIIDLSADPEDNLLDEVKGFPSLMQATEFARRYVRDSIERCRIPDAEAADVVSVWMEFGEDAIVEGNESSFQSSSEVGNWARVAGDEESRDWRSLDPRRTQPD